MFASAALVVLGAISPALVTNAPPMNSRRPIFGIVGSPCKLRDLRVSVLKLPGKTAPRSHGDHGETRSFSFLYFYGKNMCRPKHVRTKDNPFHVRSESHVRFETGIMRG